MLIATVALVTSATLSSVLIGKDYDDVPAWVFVLGWILCGLGAMLAGLTVHAMVCGVFAALHLWRWWDRHGRKRAHRALGVVRDLGHRLVVAPVAQDVR